MAANLLPSIGTTGSWRNWCARTDSKLRGNCPAVNADGVPASRSTSYRKIGEMGYANRIPRAKPLLNSKQRKKRLIAAKEKQNWTVGQWSRVVFSDESKFCISFGNQGPRVWRRPYEADKPGCTKSSIRFPQSTMVWLGMSAAGVGPVFSASKCHCCCLSRSLGAFSASDS